jgi:hypothetical protein
MYFSEESAKQKSPVRVDHAPASNVTEPMVAAENQALPRTRIERLTRTDSNDELAKHSSPMCLSSDPVSNNSD